MQAAPLRITSLSGLIGWETVTWARGAISLDASLVNDVHHARLAMLPAARPRRAVALAVGCKMPITCLAFATLWPIACLANYIHHTRQLVVAAPYGRASLPVRPGETVARNGGATFWPVMLASLILSHLTRHHYIQGTWPCVFNAAGAGRRRDGAVTLRSCYAHKTDGDDLLGRKCCAFTSASQRQRGGWGRAEMEPSCGSKTEGGSRMSQVYTCHTFFRCWGVC
jgi:hypothetical protein